MDYKTIVLFFVLGYMALIIWICFIVFNDPYIRIIGIICIVIGLLPIVGMSMDPMER